MNRPGTKGWKWSEETKKKISETCLKRTFTEEGTRKRIRALVEVCAKPVECIETGKQYKSEIDAAKDLGVNPSQISRVCLGKRYSVHGVSFRFL
jgi:hypothetical protein